MLFACLYIPDFSVQSIIRAERSGYEQAVVILDGPSSLLTVVAVNEKARLAGVLPGMTKAQCELFPVQIYRRNPIQEESAHQALLDCAFAFSPRVEDTNFVNRPDRPFPSLNHRGDTVILDIEGLQRLYASPQEIGNRLKQTAFELGLTIHVGIALTPETAQLAAWGFQGVTVIRSQSELEILGSLPIAVFELSLQQEETFRVWGIHTLHELAALPEIGLIERLGQEGKQLQALACGKNDRPLVLIQPELKFEESMEFEEAVRFLEPLTFALARLLNQLCKRLSTRHLAADKISLRLELESPQRTIQLLDPPVQKKKHTDLNTPSSTCYLATLSLPLPTEDSRTLLKLLQLHLQSHPPHTAVKKISVTTEGAHRRTTQKNLYLPSGPEPEQMEITMAKIRNIVGEQRVGTPVLLNTHRANNFELRKYSAAFSNGPAKTLEASPSLPCTVLRQFRPPIPTAVELKRNLPTAIVFENQKRTVVRAAGPWHSSGNWWDESSWSRKEWDIALASKPSRLSKDGTRKLIAAATYRLYQDLITQKWFLEGVYD